jgi:hypothetical protein
LPIVEQWASCVSGDHRYGALDRGFDGQIGKNQISRRYLVQPTALNLKADLNSPVKVVYHESVIYYYGQNKSYTQPVMT